MADRKYRNFDFGFLNTAQDATDIGEAESPSAVNLDPDQLALGSLKYEDFSTAGDSARDYLETTMGGRRFMLGDKYRSTTYPTLSYSYSDNNFILPLPYTLCLRFKIPTSGNFVYVLGNHTGVSSATEFGQIAIVRQASNALHAYIYDSTGARVCVLASSVATDTWYDLVVTADTILETSAYQIWLNGVNVFTGTSAVASTTTPEQLHIGGNFGASAEVEVRDIQIYAGFATAAKNWNGTRGSLKLVQQTGLEYLGTDIVLIPDGYGSHNVSAIRFTVTAAAPTINSTETKGVGVVRAEASGGDYTYTLDAYTQFTNTASAQSAVTNDDLLFKNDVVIAMMFDITGDSARDQVILQGGTVGGTPVGLEIRDDQGDLKAEVYDSAGSSGLVTLSGSYGSNDKKILVAHLHVVDDASTPYRADFYYNGNLLYTYKTASALNLLNTQEQLSFLNYEYPTVSNNTHVFKIYSFVVANIDAEYREAEWNVAASWDGTIGYFDEYGTRLLSCDDGDLENNEEGVDVSYTGSPSVVAASSDDGPSDAFKVNDNLTPNKPIAPTVTLVDNLNIAETGKPTGANLSVRANRNYDGPESLVIEITRISLGFAPRGLYWKYAGSDHVNQLYSASTFNLPHNIQVDLDGSFTDPFPGTWTISITATDLLDGDYGYRTVAVWASDELDPKTEVHSIPSDPAYVKIRNINSAGERISSLVPKLTLPPIQPGYPDYISRYDIYRKDPDSDEYYKIGEWRGRGDEGTFVDVEPLSSLPSVELMDVDGDEDFSTINEAIGNTSGTFTKIFNKDNRLWVVPTTRQDLLLYSRPGDWWGWRRENSFSFNGNIVEVALVRDPTVISGLLTTVVFTTKGIYHIVGEGTQDSPYTLLPTVGGDDFTNVETFPSTVVNANGAVMLATKSSDGGYDTGSYGQKIYQYDLQNLVEVSGRVRESVGSGTPVNAGLLGGDKYIYRKTATTGLVYHKDARAWVSFDEGVTGWSWTSKKFDVTRGQQGTVGSAKQFKVDYKGDVTITFYMKPYGKDTPVSKSVSLSSVSRTMYQNVLPANMGEQWYFKVEGASSTDEVYNFWFVQ